MCPYLLSTASPLKNTREFCKLFVSRALLLRLGLDSRFLLLSYSRPAAPTELGRGRDPSSTPRTESRHGFSEDFLGAGSAIATKLDPLGQGSPTGTGGKWLL